MHSLQNAPFTFLRQDRRSRRQRPEFNDSRQPRPPPDLPLEIFRKICSEILPLDPSHLPWPDILRRKDTLGTLALACTGDRREVALDFLWSYQECLHALIALVPKTDDEDHLQFFNGTGINRDSAFYRYASRIRILNIVSRPCREHDHRDIPIEEMRPRIPTENFTLLAMESKGEPLLPSQLAALAILYSPSAKTVTLKRGRSFSPSFYNAFLPIALQQFPFPKQLTLESENQAGGRSFLLLRRICQMTTLESLNLRLPGSGIDLDPLLHMLRALPRLSSITLDAHVEFHQSSRRDFTCSAADLGLDLKNLKSVHLFNRAESSLCQCLPKALFERMTCLTVIAKNTSIVDGSAGLLSPEFVGRLAEIPTLKRLDLEGGIVSGTGSLLPVVQSLGIEELNVGVDRDPQPIPFALAQSARSRRIPTLKVLSVGGLHATGHSQIAGVPVTCLQQIAEDVCPGLLHLELELLPLCSEGAWEGLATGGSPVQFVAEWLAALQNCNFASRTTLQTLVIRVRNWHRAMPLQAIRGLARIFDIIFPSLQQIRPFTEQEYDAEFWTEEWTHIEELRSFYGKERDA